MQFNNLIRSRHLISQLPIRISNCLTQKEICKFDGRRRNNNLKCDPAVKSFSTSSFKQKVKLSHSDTYTWERWWKSRIPVNNFRYEIDPYFDEEFFLEQVKGHIEFLSYHIKNENWTALANHVSSRAIESIKMQMSEEHGDDFWAINKEDIHVIFVHTIIQQRTEDNRLLDWKKNNLAEIILKFVAVDERGADWERGKCNKTEIHLGLSRDYLPYLKAMQNAVSKKHQPQGSEHWWQIGGGFFASEWEDPRRDATKHVYDKLPDWHVSRFRIYFMGNIDQEMAGQDPYSTDEKMG